MTIEAPRVLIIEDDEHTRLRLARLFERHRWTVRATGTVADGLAGLAPPPESVILDLNLPDGCGEAVLRAIRERGLPVKVVAVVTGMTDTMRLAEVATYRPSLTIMKPFDWDVLIRYCESVVRRA